MCSATDLGASPRPHQPLSLSKYTLGARHCFQARREQAVSVSVLEEVTVPRPGEDPAVFAVPSVQFTLSTLQVEQRGHTTCAFKLRQTANGPLHGYASPLSLTQS